MCEPTLSNRVCVLYLWETNNLYRGQNHHPHEFEGIFWDSKCGFNVRVLQLG